MALLKKGGPRCLVEAATAERMDEEDEEDEEVEVEEVAGEEKEKSTNQKAALLLFFPFPTHLFPLFQVRTSSL